MQFSTLLHSALIAAGLSAAAESASTPAPGYLTGFSTVNDTNLSFGKHFAVLNLDLINGLVGAVNGTSRGDAWINSTASWIDAVHEKSPRPLSIFTRIYYTNAYRPEVGPTTPFGAAAAGLGNATSDSPQSQIFPAFKTYDCDVILQKTRYSAAYGNPMVEILQSQLIDTVVLSGIRSSGVITSTTYALFDRNFKVYVIGDNVIESPSKTAQAIDTAIKTGIIPGLPADVITLKQAMAALAKSG